MLRRSAGRIYKYIMRTMMEAQKIKEGDGNITFHHLMSKHAHVSQGLQVKCLHARGNMSHGGLIENNIKKTLNQAKQDRKKRP